MQVDLDGCHWDRIRGYVTELKVDARWVLRDDDDKPQGSLRIVSHPDLRPGFLRAVFTYVTTVRNKSKAEKIKTFVDNDMEISDLEVYSIDKEIGTESETFEAPYKELNEIFGVDIFGKN